MTSIGLPQLHDTGVGVVDPGPAPLPGGAAAVVRVLMDVPRPIQIGGVLFGAIAALVIAVLLWRYRREALASLRVLPAPVLVLGIAVLLTGGAAASVAGYRVYDFVENDNRFCTGCHVMADAFVRFEESAHNQLGCKDCHAQPKTESARQLYLWVLERPMDVGPHAPVPDARCTNCHVDGEAGGWPEISASLGHRVHLDSGAEGLGELMCVSCHGVTVHEFAPVSETCGACHVAEAQIRLGAMAAETELHCVACHDFLGREPATLPGLVPGMAMLPEQTRCLSCHEMATFLEGESLDQDPHGAVCGACHDPHSQSTPMEAAGTCIGCHTDVETLTVFHTGTHAPVLADCIACHNAHSWRVDGTDCVSCHTTIPGGGSTQLPGPRAEPGLDLWAEPGPDVRAEFGTDSGPRAFSGAGWARLAMHGAGPGVGSDPIAPATRDPVATHVEPPPGSGARSFVLPVPSHTGQEPRPFTHARHTAIACVQCHGQAGEHGVVTVRTAQDCAACHHDSGRGYACADCHGEADIPAHRDVSAALDLSVWDVPRTRTLPFEHGTHDGIACQDCHTEGVLLGAAVTCAECHVDHHRPEADCATCHLPTEPGVHGLQVHLTCTSSGCHAGTVAERPPLSRTLCLVCHTDQRDHEPGMDCHACHMVPMAPPERVGTGGAATGLFGWIGS